MTISVGVCTYNGEKFIGEQLESIINQTVKPDEIIVSDDNSSDETVKIAEELLSNCGIDYKIIAYKEHQGILKNFSSCLNSCSSDIIFSCDQDDIWMEDKIESFLPYFEKGNVFVYSNAIVVDADKNLLISDFWSTYGIKFTEITKEEFSNLLLNHLCIAGCNMAFTRELYQKISPIPYHFIHDSWVAICAPWYGEIAFIDKPLIKYRRHGGNVSGFSAVDSKEIKDINQEVLNYKTITPDNWFGNVWHYYICSEIFFERMNDVINDDYRRLVRRCNRFHGILLKCLPKNRIKSILRLTNSFVIGDYKVFRGGIKTFAKDIAFLLFNKNTNFTYDTSVW